MFYISGCTAEVFFAVNNLRVTSKRRGTALGARDLFPGQFAAPVPRVGLPPALVAVFPPIFAAGTLAADGCGAVLLRKNSCRAF
jgi:hypothetical protein